MISSKGVRDLNMPNILAAAELDSSFRFVGRRHEILTKHICMHHKNLLFPLLIAEIAGLHTSIY